ncbi:hypothetical protein QM787_26975 [Rhodococcus ruber]|uniref:Uncharacterized protein n=1 Tax=Rhodococcus ruber TaxID=1830 RepID=A0A098BQ08_9NOCA|nr:hypothetical protein [Rhodococcus ruber]MCZ4506601.1 hypothetical protein [Rhodococcus ruber]MCZ4533834.1 hypothetical protein [Rhodococcus ruber]MCZ4624054.1 hypothetical protein [Rhodococcus ruber]MDI9985531.1 hypothetical protein [Rhodococcus ruber]MDJ0000988.1 hypothetical protein [Rhodococcus ruber]
MNALDDQLEAVRAAEQAAHSLQPVRRKNIIAHPHDTPAYP